MKASEAHKMSDQEIREEAHRLRAEHFKVRSQAVTQKLEDPSLLLKLRRDLARVLTEQRARQIKEAK